MTEFSDAGEVKVCHPAVVAGLGASKTIAAPHAARPRRRTIQPDFAAWRELCRAVPTMRPVPEMSLDELLADPIVLDLMAADNVDPAALRAALREVANQLARRRSADVAC